MIFCGDPIEDMETAKRLTGAYPYSDIGSLATTAADQGAPHSARIAAVYVLGFTHDDLRTRETLTRIIDDAGEPEDVRDHAVEALASITPPG